MTIVLLRSPRFVPRFGLRRPSVNGRTNEQADAPADSRPQLHADSIVTLIEVAQLYTSLEPHPVKGFCSQTDRDTFEHGLRSFCHQANLANGGRPAKIKDSFFCSSLPAGAVLLGQPSNRLYVTFPPSAQAPAWITEQLVKALMLYIEIREILRSRNRVICLEMVFACIVQLLRLMGNEDWRLKHEPHQCHPDRVEWQLSPWPELRRVYEEELRQGADLVRRAAQRQAQVDYFLGMLGGVLALGMLLFLVFGRVDWLGIQFGLVSQAAPLLWLCPLVGGMGAIVSVMQRMSTGNCALRDRAGRFELSLVGAFRPLIGAIFASVIVALVAGGLVPVQLQSTTGDPLHFLLYGVLAFFSGFSERFAQDMLGAGKGQLNSGTDAERRAAAT